jgi:hypothetical protein
MRRISTLVLCLSLATLADACSSMTVRADHDSQVDFGSFESFALFERQNAKHRPPQMSELVDRRIAEALSSELSARGFDATTPRRADLLVTFYTAVRKRVVVNRSGWYGYRWRYWGGGVTHVSSYPEGTLVIDVIDRQSRELVWRGVGQGAFTKMNPSDDKVAQRVGRILRDFPPI